MINISFVKKKKSVNKTLNWFARQCYARLITIRVLTKKKKKNNAIQIGTFYLTTHDVNNVINKYFTTVQQCLYLITFLQNYFKMIVHLVFKFHRTQIF